MLAESPALRAGAKTGLNVNSLQKGDAKMKFEDGIGSPVRPKVVKLGYKTNGQNSMESLVSETNDWSPSDLLKERNSKFTSNPIMESRKKDLLLAKKIQRKCYSKFLKEKSE